MHYQHGLVNPHPQDLPSFVNQKYKGIALLLKNVEDVTINF